MVILPINIFYVNIFTPAKSAELPFNRLDSNTNANANRASQDAVQIHNAHLEQRIIEILIS